MRTLAMNDPSMSPLASAAARHVLAWACRNVVSIAHMPCRHDSVSRSLLEQATMYMVPSMNPDGAWRGHLRTNACGINLNRAWANPSLADAPEVYHVLTKMRETGVDMLVDVHGDEAIPHNFIAYSEGIPGYTEKMETLKQKFSKFLQRANPDFQTVRIYTHIQSPMRVYTLLSYRPHGVVPGRARRQVRGTTSHCEGFLVLWLSA